MISPDESNTPSQGGPPPRSDPAPAGVGDAESESGEDSASFRELYNELRRMASLLLRNERSNHTLQPTALVHEAWLRLGRADGQGWDSRAHFFSAAAIAMRRVLVDYARRRGALKRNSGHRPVTIQEDHAFCEANEIDILHLDQLLTELQKLDGRMAQVVMYRVFADMPMQEIAEVVGVTRRTVQSDWAVARKWLRHKLAEDV